MTDLKDQARVVKRKGSNNYYYRRRVPAHLFAHFGKAEVIFSLQTADRREAMRRATLEDAKFDEKVRQLTATLNPTEAAELSEVEIEALALIYKASILGDDMDARKEASLGGPLAWMYDRMDPAPITDELEALDVALSVPKELLRNTAHEERFQ